LSLLLHPSGSTREDRIGSLLVHCIRHVRQFTQQEVRWKPDNIADQDEAWNLNKEMQYIPIEFQEQ